MTAGAAKLMLTTWFRAAADRGARAWLSGEDDDELDVATACLLFAAWLDGLHESDVRWRALQDVSEPALAATLGVLGRQVNGMGATNGWGYNRAFNSFFSALCVRAATAAPATE